MVSGGPHLAEGEFLLRSFHPSRYHVSPAECLSLKLHLGLEAGQVGWAGLAATLRYAAVELTTPL